MAKKMPHHANAERAILGTIFLDPQRMVSIIDIVESRQFYEQAHMLIFDAMKDLFTENKEIDVASVASRLEQKEQLTKVGGLDYLFDITSFVPSLEHLNTYIDLVLETALKRDIINVTAEISEEGITADISATDYLDKAEGKIFELSRQRKIGYFSQIRKIISDVKEKTELNKNKKSGVTGLATGYEDLDRATLGLQPEELIILAARPAMGKSAFAMNLAVNIAKRNKNGHAGVAIFSLEMSNEQLATRMISNEAGIENSKLRNGNLSAAEWSLFELKSDVLNNLNIFFDDASNTSMAEIRAKCRKLSQENKLDFVVIDYLQLIDDDKSGKRQSNRQEEVAKISRALKQMARELKVPVLALSQLSRNVETRENKQPVLSDLRESGSIEQDADIVMFLYRDDYYTKGEDRSQPGPAELDIAKNRHGSLKKIKFIFSPQYSRFTPHSDREE